VSTPHLLLGLLAGGARHGYELKRAHDARLPQAKPLAFGQVYSTLGRLERDGYVVPAGHEQEAGPERTRYEITDLGREHLGHWLEEVEPPMPHVTNTLLVKVLVALLAADEVVARSYLTRQRAAHTVRVRELTRVKVDAEPGQASTIIAADYAIAHLDADLRWLESTVGRLGMLKREVRG
jgi:DNA-binding PadR family transcriptional regulator